jgi:hypothetical protein
MTNLVDLETAKGHLRMDEDHADDVIYSKIAQASAIVIGYLKKDPDIWDIDSTESEPIPKVVEAAVLLIMEALFDGTEPLSQTVKDLLHRHRDPALA